MAHQRRQHREKLIIRELESSHRKSVRPFKVGRESSALGSGIDIADSIHLQDGLDGPRLCLQVLQHVVRKEPDDVHQAVRARNSVLESQS